MGIFFIFIIRLKPLQIEDAALPQIYGSLVGLSELGPDVIRRIILPKLRRISERMDSVLVCK